MVFLFNYELNELNELNFAACAADFYELRFHPNS